MAPKDCTGMKLKFEIWIRNWYPEFIISIDKLGLSCAKPASRAGAGAGAWLSLAIEQDRVRWTEKIVLYS